MSEVRFLRGNQAAAVAAKLSRIEFMGAYPIPPSSEIMETIRTFIQQGELKAAFIEADGEKSAQLACFASSCAGCRTFNATSSQGILYMNETLHLMAGERMPMVMVVGTRSVFAPHSMKCDHTDAMSQRDTGWLQIFCESVQEVLDTVIQAFKISEHPKVKLPIMVCEDGYNTTHSLERVIIPSQEEVDAFLPPYQPSEIDHLEPGGLSLFTSFGVMENWFTEFKYLDRQAMEAAKDVIDQVDDEFTTAFGRRHGGLIDPYMVEDAEVVLIMMGSMCMTARFAINVMRKVGKKVGLLKIRSYRPFPYEKIAEAIDNSKAKAVVVLDRMNANALRDEIRSALYPLERRPLVIGFIVGLNGRDVAPYNMIDLAEQGFATAKKGYVDKDQQMYMVRTRDFFEREASSVKEI
jgi:pyruvate ferredoxin oxidoreductase alpha subunit